MSFQAIFPQMAQSVGSQRVHVTSLRDDDEGEIDWDDLEEVRGMVRATEAEV
jgi:hypothetical protein